MKRALLAAAALAVGLAPFAADAQDRGRHDRGRDAAVHRSYAPPAVQAPAYRHAPQAQVQRHAPQSRHAPSHRHAPPPARHVRHHAPPPRVVYTYAPHRYQYARYNPPRGYVYRDWRPGYTLPVSYRAPQYVLDYRHYRLPPPPRGYHYVRVDDHAVLAAVASGLIADVLFDLFYR